MGERTANICFEGTGIRELTVSHRFVNSGAINTMRAGKLSGMRCKKHKYGYNMANIITGIRILCSIAILFTKFPSPAFYFLYVTAGITDMIDGAAARKANTVSEFGAKLDTAADFVFVAVCLLKLIPLLDIPKWLYIWTAVIALVKVINIVCGYVMRRKFVAAHTVMNKVTGILLFILPLTMQTLDLKYTGAAVCTVALFAAVQEGHYIRTGKV